MMSRANARELAVHLIYSQELTGQEPAELLEQRLNKEYFSTLSAENELYAELPGSAQRRYLDTVLTGVANRQEELNSEIRQYSIGWDVSRISRMTRAIMQLAIYEIQFMDDVPTNVAISEAVRLAKKYDGDDTGSFVNGILGSFARSQSGAAK